MALFYLALVIVVLGLIVLHVFFMPEWLVRIVKLIVVFAFAFWVLWMANAFPEIATHRIF